MINLIPTATVIFTDGHKETSTSVFMIKNKHYVVCVKSGAYECKGSEPIRKYHPEYLTTIESATGDIEYDYSYCWVIDSSVDNIVIDWR